MPVLLSGIFLLLSSLVGVYTIVILARVLMTWIPGFDFGKVGAVLASITDPFLNLFRRIPWLKLGGFDLSIIGAFITLNALSQTFHSLGTLAALRLSILLIILVQAVASGIGFILWFILILTLIRLFSILLRIPSFAPFWQTIDSLLQPMIFPLAQKLFPSRILPYGTSLMAFGVGIILVLVAGRFLLVGLSLLIGLIPI